MKKVDISSMFLVPENIYTSMLSHINENDVRENIKSLNRDKDDGNYIEKAINFNKQQERQRKQVFLNPNATNETVRTYANTDANTSVQTNNLNQTFDNTENFHTPMINQSETAVTSTPKNSRAVSRIRPLFSPMRPIEESFSETNAEGNYVCSFCNNKYKKADELQNHFLKDHNQDMHQKEHSSVMNQTFNLPTTQNSNANIPNYLNDSDIRMTPQNNSQNFNITNPTSTYTPVFRNTGAVPKTRKKGSPYAIPTTNELIQYRGRDEIYKASKKPSEKNTTTPVKPNKNTAKKTAQNSNNQPNSPRNLRSRLSKKRKLLNEKDDTLPSKRRKTQHKKNEPRRSKKRKLSNENNDTSPNKRRKTQHKKNEPKTSKKKKKISNKKINTSEKKKKKVIEKKGEIQTRMKIITVPLVTQKKLIEINMEE